MKLKFSESFAQQLQELIRTTRRTPQELIECLAEPLLSQIVDGNDAQLMKDIILDIT